MRKSVPIGILLLSILPYFGAIRFILAFGELKSSRAEMEAAEFAQRLGDLIPYLGNTLFFMVLAVAGFIWLKKKYEKNEYKIIRTIVLVNIFLPFCLAVAYLVFGIKS